MIRINEGCRALTWIGLAIAFAGMHVDSFADDVAFVAAFERFARHDEISQIEAGRLLITELNCTQCHHSDHAMLSPKGGPSLRSAGGRLTASWVREYVASPSSVHPETTMPDVLGALNAEQRKTVANDIAAFLATQQASFPEVKATGAVPVPSEFWNRGNVAAGRTLYRTIGCVACHEPGDDFEVTGPARSPIDQMIDQLSADEIEDLGLSAAARPIPSVPHSDLATKYTPQGLTFFLLEPKHDRPGSRMPNLKLTPVEAADLASYLIDRTAPESDAVQDQTITGNAELGRQAFERFGCAACHKVGGLSVDSDAPKRPALAALRRDDSGGCLQARHAKGPAYSLDDFQRSAIATALAATNSRTPASAVDRLQHRMMQLNCYACHVRDELGGVGRRRKDYFQSVGNIDLGDEGRLPPDLTGAGRKITPTWMTKVLAGNNADIRPHMTIRMPKFGADHVADLPNWMTDVDGRRKLPHTAAIDSKQPSKVVVEAGRTLMDIGCIQCHSFDGVSMPAVVGVDLSGVTGRVNRDWFDAFLHDPGSLKSRTRMPNFFADGKAQDQKLLGGDPDRQIAAMWSYLQDVPKHSLPQRIQQARAQNYELVPKDRPILLRTFMETAGEHAIAVGNPQGVHYAFDADQVRLATAWRGKFLDAQGTWFVRFAPPAAPLGISLIEFPNENVFWGVGRADANGNDFELVPAQHRFGGYRLDSDGVPTFLYRVGDIAIEEQIVAMKDGSLQRTWRFLPDPNSSNRIAFSPLAGKTVDAMEGNRFVNDKGLTVYVDRLPADAATVISGRDPSGSGPQRVVYLIDIPSATTFEASYSW
ncbi:MAG: c-type cytochrome [Rubripirellula sp.]